METSIFSSQKHVTSPSSPITQVDSEPEESGWTQYIDDFARNNEDDRSYYTGSLISESLVSDAGTGPEWKNKITSNKGLPNMPKKLKFKKFPFDDSLEDTASSPVNSPKITTFFNGMDINPKDMENDDDSPMGDEISIDRRVEFNGVKGNDIDNVDLKQKGLCLVPVSMVLTYLDS